MYYLLSILVGILPESIYFTMFLCAAKSIKKRRALLFLLIFISNVLLALIIPQTIWYHLVLIAAIYGCLRLICRADIIDIFIVSLACIVLSLLSGALYFVISSYYIFLAANRIAILVAAICFRDRWREFYMSYRRVWNKSPGAKIKSITVRNISCIALNLLMFATSIVLNYIISMNLV